MYKPFTYRSHVYVTLKCLLSFNLCCKSVLVALFF